jgi:poly(glycerol-phosphate) alpha-glucosyltransferase
MQTAPAAFPYNTWERDRKNLNILFGTGSLYQYSGPFFSLLGTVHALRRKGYFPRVIGTRDRWDSQPRLNWHPIPAYAFHKMGPSSLHWTPALPFWLRRFPEPVDIVSLQNVWLYSNYQISRWSRQRNIPYMVTIRGNLHPRALAISAWKKKIAQRWFANDLLANARCLQALNEAEYRAIRVCGLTQPVCVIPNGVECPEMTPPALLSSHEKICLYLGRIHPIKGLENLIQAWAGLGDARKDWRLVIAGPDENGYGKRLEHIANTSGVNDSVLFPGPQYGSDKAKWFQRARVFTLPSQSEGLSMAVLEAMSFGLPVLLTDSCNFPDVSIHRAGIQTGGSLEELKTGLTEMLHMGDNERREMGKKGRDLVMGQYTWEIITDRLIEVYQWMSGRTEMPSCVISD